MRRVNLSLFNQSTFLVNRIASFEATLEGFFSLFLARLSYKPTGVVLLMVGFLFFQILFPSFSFVFAETSTNTHLQTPFSPLTKSLFSEKSHTTNQVLKHTKKFIVDPALEPGESKILSKGKDGKKTFATKITYHNGAEFGREHTLIAETLPVEEIVAVGAETGNESLETPFGILTYSRKLTVWATAYDSSCRGCNSTTAIGLQAGHGVIAVDPTVIPLRSKVYIPGYGIAIAGDTGGSIKGNKIDLGFNNVAQSGWFSKYTEIYILQ